MPTAKPNEHQSAAMLKAGDAFEEAKTAYLKARKRLQDVCTHLYYDGSSAVKGLNDDCAICELLHEKYL